MRLFLSPLILRPCYSLLQLKKKAELSSGQGKSEGRNGHDAGAMRGGDCGGGGQRRDARRRRC